MNTINFETLGYDIDKLNISINGDIVFTTNLGNVIYYQHKTKSFHELIDDLDIMIVKFSNCGNFIACIYKDLSRDIDIFYNENHYDIIGLDDEIIKLRVSIDFFFTSK